MAKKTFNFELGNRDLFPSELEVVNKAKASLIASAARHGKTIEASALFRGKSMATAAVLEHGARKSPNAADAAEHTQTSGKVPPRKPA